MQLPMLQQQSLRIVLPKIRRVMWRGIIWRSRRKMMPFLPAKMTSSEQFFDAIRKHFPEVPERWYRRSMEILQRAKFGGKKLAPYEIYTLDCFEEKSHRMVYKKQNVGGKLWIRYGLCVEK